MTPKQLAYFARLGDENAQAEIKRRLGESLETPTPPGRPDSKARSDGEE
jgi:hypothetical protein